jgi:hypothetical protein
MVEMNRCIEKDYKGSGDFVWGLRHNKRKSNLYDLKKLEKMKKIVPEAMDKPIEN